MSLETQSVGRRAQKPWQRDNPPNRFRDENGPRYSVLYILLRRVDLMALGGSVVCIPDITGCLWILRILVLGVMVVRRRLAATGNLCWLHKPRSTRCRPVANLVSHSSGRNNFFKHRHPKAPYSSQRRQPGSVNLSRPTSCKLTSVTAQNESVSAVNRVFIGWQYP